MALEPENWYSRRVARARFEWDPAKDLENQQKHRVSFAEAQHAFADSRRVLAEDLEHSAAEQRYYCFGRTSGGILTVRFTYRLGVRRISGAGSSAPDSGARERRSMTARTKYTDEPLGEVRVVPDFLPRPDQLAFRDAGVKVTIALSKRSVEFFKSHAAINRTQYQRMIRQLLDAYVDAYTEPTTRSQKRSSKRTSGRRAAS